MVFTGKLLYKSQADFIYFAFYVSLLELTWPHRPSKIWGLLKNPREATVVSEFLWKYYPAFICLHQILGQITNKLQGLQTSSFQFGLATVFKSRIPKENLAPQTSEVGTAWRMDSS